MIITWTVNDRGSPITSFDVKIRESDGLTFTSEAVSCLPSDAILISTMSCSVPITTLLASPYNLPWGSSIFAQISATNSYGTSVLSQGDNGAIILTVPSAVVVSNYDAGTSATQIVINWTEAPENGGTLVLDYEI